MDRSQATSWHSMTLSFSPPGPSDLHAPAGGWGGEGVRFKNFLFVLLRALLYPLPRDLVASEELSGDHLGCMVAPWCSGNTWFSASPLGLVLQKASPVDASLRSRVFVERAI